MPTLQKDLNPVLNKTHVFAYQDSCFLSSFWIGQLVTIIYLFIYNNFIEDNIKFKRV